MSNQHRDEVIRMARESGAPDWWIGIGADGSASGGSALSWISKFADLAVAGSSEKKRSDALAATINNILNITTTDAEGKADFVARVNAILSQCPDARVLHAVEAEREACAKAAENEPRVWDVNAADPQRRIAAAIRARSNVKLFGFDVVVDESLPKGAMMAVMPKTGA